MNRNVHVPFLGEGQRQRCSLTRLRAIVPDHLNHAGIHVGRMSAKEKGGFTITTAKGKITDVGKKYCRMLQRADGYGYSQQCAPAGAFLSSLSLKA